MTHVKSLPTLVLASCLLAPAAMAGKSVLLVAGPPSHGPGCHEHPAGCELLAMHLCSSGLDIAAKVSLGWPTDPAEARRRRHPGDLQRRRTGPSAAGHLDALKARHQAGKGLAVLHWALGPADDEMKAFLMEAIGGQFEPDWSVNPMWTMNEPIIAAGHPATRGITPFEAKDEWYFHIRLRDDVTPLLQAHPPADVLGKKDGTYSGNPAVRKALEDKLPQTLAWAVENANGSRGFGFTGGHFQTLWSNAGFRKVVLNGIGWTAGVEIPESGIDGKLAEPAYASIDLAIAKGSTADLRVLLALHPEWATQGSSGRTPLDVAILRNKPEMAELLLAYGADPNGAADASRSPLHLAVEPQERRPRPPPCSRPAPNPTGSTRAAGPRSTTPRPKTRSTPPRRSSTAAPTR